MSVQSLLEKFYSIDNLVSVDITIPDDQWKNLSTADPRWGWRQWATVDQIKNARKYDWFAATNVTISGAKFPTKAEFNGVAIIKKSFAGSEHKVKPSIKIDFSRWKTASGNLDKQQVKQNEAAIEALIGTRRLVLNNSKQDEAYVRQPLGYEIFRQGGIPYARCNLAKVTVNGNSLGIYVNLEPIQEPYLQRNFGNDKGNLYETEAFYDLNDDNFANGKLYDQDGFSPYEDGLDLRLATQEINKGMASASRVVDIPGLIRGLAMQALVRHWDGYPNNTFHYNDSVAVAKPQAQNVKLKFIPSGIDSILSNDPKMIFEVKKEGILSKLILADADARKQLVAALADCAAVFDKNLAANLALVDQMADLIKKANVFDADKGPRNVDVPREVELVKMQMRKVKEGMGGVRV